MTDDRGPDQSSATEVRVRSSRPRGMRWARRRAGSGRRLEFNGVGRDLNQQTGAEIIDVTGRHH